MSKLEDKLYEIGYGHTMAEYIEEIIILQDVAKRIWGESESQSKMMPQKHWEYHIQEMVISNDPSKYLEENL